MSARERDRGGGAGLGLSIASQIVERHGGVITVEPTPDVHRARAATHQRNGRDSQIGVVLVTSYLVSTYFVEAGGRSSGSNPGATDQ